MFCRLNVQIYLQHCHILISVLHQLQGSEQTRHSACKRTQYEPHTGQPWDWPPMMMTWCKTGGLSMWVWGWLLLSIHCRLTYSLLLIPRSSLQLTDRTSLVSQHSAGSTFQFVVIVPLTLFSSKSIELYKQVLNEAVKTDIFQTKCSDLENIANSHNYVVSYCNDTNNALLTLLSSTNKNNVCHSGDRGGHRASSIFSPTRQWCSSLAFLWYRIWRQSLFKVITIVMSGKRRWLKTSSTWSWGRWRQLERFSRNLQNAISGEYQLDNFIGYKSFIVISSSQKLLETLKSEKVREGYVSGRNKLPVKRNFGQDEEKEKLINMMEHISTTVDTLRVKRRSIKKLSSL